MLREIDVVLASVIVGAAFSYVDADVVLVIVVFVFFTVEAVAMIAATADFDHILLRLEFLLGRAAMQLLRVRHDCANGG